MESTNNLYYGFGEILRRYRKGKHITQKQLAKLLGVHYNTISSWELGTYLPETRGLIVELSRHLELNEQETRQLLEASLTALSPHWHLPAPRNPFFIAREEVLHTLHTFLQGDQPSCVLCGLGGIGKTQIALEYAYRYAQEYAAVFWVGAETTESIISSFVFIASLLGLSNDQDSNLQQTIAEVQHWLNSHRQWLLIWDNVENVEILSDFLPAARQGTMLFTTTRQTLGNLAQRIEVQPITEEEGVLYLFRRARQVGSTVTTTSLSSLKQLRPTEYIAAREIVRAMDGLPLALDQVGAYIDETPCSLAEYFKLYQIRRAELLKRRGDAIIDHPASVVTTWSLSFEKVKQINTAAANLLRLCAFLHPDAIPEEIFTKGASCLGKTLGLVASDTFLLNEVFRAISAYSLISRNTEYRTLTMHRLVQVVIRDNMDVTTAHIWIERAVDVINVVCSENEENMNWVNCERYIPHFQACQVLIEQTKMNRPQAVSLLHRMGRYLLVHGRYKEAESSLMGALTMIEQNYGANHIDLAIVQDDLAKLYWYQGKYEQAELLEVRALKIHEQQLGQEHPETAKCLDNLATLCLTLIKYEQAELLAKRALAIRERLLGQEHLDTSLSLSTLGRLYQEQSKYEQAEPLFYRSLTICEQQLGPEHLQTAQGLVFLGILYREQGKYTQAETLLQRALSIRERHLGPEHPHTAQCLGALGVLYREQGKYTQAETLLQRALSIRERHLGPEHPHTAQCLEALGVLYREQGKYTQAETLLQRALSIREQHFSLDHPSTTRYLESLGALYREQEKYAQAESILQRALTICRKYLGWIHPSTALVLWDLALLYQRQNKNIQAKAFYQDAATTFEQSLGREHPKTIRIMSDHRFLLETPC